MRTLFGVVHLLFMTPQNLLFMTPQKFQILYNSLNQMKDVLWVVQLLIVPLK